MPTSSDFIPFLSQGFPRGILVTATWRGGASGRAGRRSAVNIQIFGTNKCFDTKKAQRWFQERRIKFQYVDVKKYGMSRGELSSVRNAVGLEAMVDSRHPDAVLLSYLADDQAKLDKLFEIPALLRTPIVRNGKQASVGYCPEIWDSWK